MMRRRLHWTVLDSSPRGCSISRLRGSETGDSREEEVWMCTPRSSTDLNYASTASSIKTSGGQWLGMNNTITNIAQGSDMILQTCRACITSKCHSDRASVNNARRTCSGDYVGIRRSTGQYAGSNRPRPIIFTYVVRPPRPHHFMHPTHPRLKTRHSSLRPRSCDHR